jgi:hypothetical protein
LATHPALFRTFADLPYTEGEDARGEVLAFANEYGDLGRRVGVSIRDAAAGDVSTMGEPHVLWAREILEMRRAVDLREMINSKDYRRLSACFRWRPARSGEDGGPLCDARWVYDSHPNLPRDEFPFPMRFSKGIAADEVPDLAADLDDARSRNDLFTPATITLMRWVDQKLERHTSTRFLYNRDDGRLSLHTVPDSLLAALWLQFARAVAVDGLEYPCKGCGKWFVVSADGRKAKSLFCKNACKSKDYRRRRDRALELAAPRKTPSKIAEQLKAEGLETDVKKVTDWIKANRG